MVGIVLRRGGVKLRCRVGIRVGRWYIYVGSAFGRFGGEGLRPILFLRPSRVEVNNERGDSWT